MRYVDVGRAALVVREKVMKEPSPRRAGRTRAPANSLALEALVMTEEFQFFWIIIIDAIETKVILIWLTWH